VENNKPKHMYVMKNDTRGIILHVYTVPGMQHISVYLIGYNKKKNSNGRDKHSYLNKVESTQYPFQGLHHHSQVQSSCMCIPQNSSPLKKASARPMT
jgi:hypothetical protein